jgi:hypothetical protein
MGREMKSSRPISVSRACRGKKGSPIDGAHLSVRNGTLSSVSYLATAADSTGNRGSGGSGFSPGKGRGGPARTEGGVGCSSRPPPASSDTGAALVRRIERRPWRRAWWRRTRDTTRRAKGGCLGVIYEWRASFRLIMDGFDGV